jgi:PadR family transcriptional regulator AphA
MSPNIRRSLSIELSLLGFLHQNPLHGYQIYQHLCDPSGLGLVWRLKQSQLYALLSRLEDEGYITAELQPQDTRPTGRGTYLEWIRAPVAAPRRIRQEFLAKLFFARQEGPGAAIQLIREQQSVCLEAIEEQIARLPDSPESEPQVWLICQYRIHYLQAILEWLKLCERTQVAEVLR